MPSSVHWKLFMQRDQQYLLDILESAKIAIDHIAGYSWDEFSVDIRDQDAVIRR